MYRHMGSRMIRLLTVAISCIVMTMTGCAQQGALSRSEPVFYPPLPQEPRIQFLTTIANENSLAQREGGSFREFVVGADASRPVKSLKRPVSLSHDLGTLYVLDRGFSIVTAIDLKTGKFRYLDDISGGLPVQPASVFTDRDGTLYVADMQRREILVYDNLGWFQTSFAVDGNSVPVDAVVIGERVFVLDIAEHRILVLDKVTGEKITELSGPGLETGFLNKPSHLAVTQDDKIAVTDVLNYRVQILSADGEFVDSYGQLGQGRGAVVRPKGLDVDRDGNIYLTDVGFEMVTIFDSVSGTPRMSFGKSGSGAGSLFMPSDVHIDYDNVEYFRKFADPNLNLEYLIYVSNGFSSVNVYGFGKWTGPLRATKRRNDNMPVRETKNEVPSLGEIENTNEPNM